MFSVIMSIILCLVGMFLGGIFNSDLYIFMFGLLGILIPPIYLLEKIYFLLRSKK
ncbi:hypothetical protein [Clostridium sp. Marseille-Q2269]|uniref:hypothetical protein n=1 Tax=Clostridium sp. Marseille-Q2269 TaxID=2942205 RepID=UPI002073FF89|nr:hypothetical protein [Clostridium sp. Marseille-Q2269]